MKDTFTRIIPIILCFLFLLNPSMVMANSAPVIQPEPNGIIIPVDDTPIVVKEEKLQFVLYENYKPADVTVQYVFINPTEHPIDTYLAFPYTSSDSPQIFINDKPVIENEIKIQRKEAQISGFLEKFHSSQFLYMDPITGKQRNWKGYDMIKKSDAATFKVTFAARQETKLKIEYQQAFGFDRRSYINPVYFYEYLLQPASSWKEFHQLQIRIAVPKHHYFAANLPMKANHDNLNEWLPLPKEVGQHPKKWDYFKGEFSSLPKENLAFSIMNKDQIFLGMVKKNGYDTIGIIYLLLVATLTIVGITLLISKIKKWWMRWILGPILSFIVSNTLTFLSYAVFIDLVPAAANGELIGGYGFIFTFLFFGFYNTLIYFPILLIVVLVKKRRFKKQLMSIEGL